MIEQIIYFLRGYLLIAIRGNALERFIDQMVRKGIVLRHLERVEKDFYRAEIEINDFKKLRPIVRRRLCRVNIIKKIGLPFLIQKARVRSFLVAGFIVFFLVIWLGSSHLWFIEMNGLERINGYQITNKLSDYGIKTGVKKDNINLKKIEDRLVDDFPGIVWIDVQWKGTKLYIDIVEKQEVEKTKAYDIVAQKDSVITELIVLNGQPVVKEGDTVTKGEKLIVGLTDENGKKRKARGIVNAEVWYNVRGKVDIVNKQYIYTGKNNKQFGFKVGNFSLLLPPGKPEFDKYIKKINLKELLKWRNIGLTLELIKEENIEFKSYENIRSKNLATYHAKKRALEKLFGQLSSGSSIEAVYIENYNYDKAKKTIEVLFIVRTKENIASKEGDFRG
jgi:similar to stage IV sporulation protein